jgi:hypothetical protein
MERALRAHPREPLSALIALTTILIWGVFAVQGRAHAGVMVPPFPYLAKDFAFVYANDQFHIFYIRHSIFAADDSTERDFGHAVSSDLVNWTQMDSVLRVRPGKWDNLHVWAPCVIAREDTFYMYYTGVTEIPGVANHVQSIGLAVSTDLLNWTRADSPVLACGQIPWALCDSLDATTSLRDPFVMDDPAAPGHLLMYYTAVLASDPTQLIAGLAASDGDPRIWHDVMPLKNTQRGQSFSSKIESAHVFQHDALWYLFYTTDSGHPINFETSASPTADSASWGPQVHLSTEVPTDGTDTWFASEHLHIGPHDYFAAADNASGGVQVRDMVWDTPPHFHLDTTSVAAVPPPPTSVARGVRMVCLSPTGHGGLWTLELSVPAACEAEVFVTDAAGRRVVDLGRFPLRVGGSSVTWSGTGAGGSRVRSGIYWAVLRTRFGDASAKMLVVR